MLTNVPEVASNGVVSVLVTYTEVSPPEPRLGPLIPDNHAGLPDSHTDLTRSTLDGTTAPQGGRVVHCGTPMQLVTPAVGLEAASYTFAPADAVGTELPPVWRCGCGFQLDAWSAGPRRGHASVVSPV